MFSEEFLHERRQAFADSIVSVWYKYTITDTGITGYAGADLDSATVSGNAITFTVELGNIQQVKHSVNTIYMFSKATKSVSEGTDGDPEGYAVKADINTAVNATQTMLIKLKVTYVEVYEMSESGTGN